MAFSTHTNSSFTGSPVIAGSSLYGEAAKSPSQLKQPLRTLFLITSMPVGGAETLLVNMIRRFDNDRIQPSVACMKDKGPLGEAISNEVCVTSNWIHGKYDAGIVVRLSEYMRRERFGAVVTVGAGDKMFWGRLAARLAGVRVICSALHSTGWPDGVGFLNRMLTPITDAFIAVAKPHGEFLVSFEKFPASKVVVIPNGVDTEHFQPCAEYRIQVRKELGLEPDTPIIGTVSALRPEKNHALFLEAASRVLKLIPMTQFVIVGDGPERGNIEAKITQLGIGGNVKLLGTRSDTPRLVAAMDAFALTSHNEASPVSILEALACEVPVVATRVGSIAESVIDDANGYTVDPGDAAALTSNLVKLLQIQELRSTLGKHGRQHVIQNGSLETMVTAYEELMTSIYLKKQQHIDNWRAPLHFLGSES